MGIVQSGDRERRESGVSVVNNGASGDRDPRRDRRGRDRAQLPRLEAATGDAECLVEGLGALLGQLRDGVVTAPPKPARPMAPRRRSAGSSTGQGRDQPRSPPVVTALEVNGRAARLAAAHPILESSNRGAEEAGWPKPPRLVMLCLRLTLLRVDRVLRRPDQVTARERAVRGGAGAAVQAEHLIRQQCGHVGDGLRRGHGDRLGRRVGNAGARCDDQILVAPARGSDRPGDEASNVTNLVPKSSFGFAWVIDAGPLASVMAPWLPVKVPPVQSGAMLPPVSG